MIRSTVHFKTKLKTLGPVIWFCIHFGIAICCLACFLLLQVLHVVLHALCYRRFYVLSCILVLQILRVVLRIACILVLQIFDVFWSEADFFIPLLCKPWAQSQMCVHNFHISWQLYGTNTFLVWQMSVAVSEEDSGVMVAGAVDEEAEKATDSMLVGDSEMITISVTGQWHIQFIPSFFYSTPHRLTHILYPLFVSKPYRCVLCLFCQYAT